jgi:hypothetical protein
MNFKHFALLLGAGLGAASCAAQAPSIVGISLGMPYTQAQKIGNTMYPSKTSDGAAYTNGPAHIGQEWWHAEGRKWDSIGVATTQKGQVYFVSRSKEYMGDTPKPTWENFRKALVEQYGPPATERNDGSDHNWMTWYFDSAWHSVSAESLTPGCKDGPAFQTGGVPTMSLWIPRTVRSNCPVGLWVWVQRDTDPNLVFCYRSTMLDERAAFLDSRDVQALINQQNEQRRREQDKVKPSF